MALYGVNIKLWVVAVAAGISLQQSNILICFCKLYLSEADVLRPQELSGANPVTHGDRELIMQRN